MTADAVILFEPDGYVVDGPRLMGRHAAGNSFLRAAVAGRRRSPMICMTGSRASAETFAKMVREIDPSAGAAWLPSDKLDALAKMGTLYLPMPDIDDHAAIRLRVGPAAYSIVGVTHTTASHAAMDAIAGLLSGPVMPWDALICPSDAVLSTIKTVLEAERDYLEWRFACRTRTPMPVLPVIPLGVHCRDFDFGPEERQRAREALGIGADEVVALFVGRLSFHAKAHPHAMYVGLEAAAKRTGKRTTLVQCGWFASAAIENAFKDGAREFAPTVRSLFTGGRDTASRRRSWAAADLFVSLSDNIQETFGLSPVEAMAAGLPVVVTDWDGYKETVRDGIDGFRIPTLMAEPGLGDRFAAAYASGAWSYDEYSALVSRTVSISIDVLIDRLSELMTSPELRQRLGGEGAKRARSTFDWTVIYPRYQSLYDELAARRREALESPSMQAMLRAAPKVRASRLDPFHAFRTYPTHSIGAATVFALCPGASLDHYSALMRHPIWGFRPQSLPPEQVFGAVLAALAQGPTSVEALAERCGIVQLTVLYAAAVLAKMGLVRRFAGDEDRTRAARSVRK